MSTPQRNTWYRLGRSRAPFPPPTNLEFSFWKGGTTPCRLRGTRPSQGQVGSWRRRGSLEQRSLIGPSQAVAMFYIWAARPFRNQLWTLSPYSVARATEEVMIFCHCTSLKTRQHRSRNCALVSCALTLPRSLERQQPAYDTHRTEWWNPPGKTNQLRKKDLETDICGFSSETVRPPSRPPVRQSHWGRHSLRHTVCLISFLSTPFQIKVGS